MASFCVQSHVTTSKYLPEHELARLEVDLSARCVDLIGKRIGDGLAKHLGRLWQYSADTRTVNEQPETLLVWNMRAQVPPVELDHAARRYRVVKEVQPSTGGTYPEVGDIVALDCNTREIVDKLVQDFDHQWSDPESFIRRRFPDEPMKVFSIGLANHTVSDVPYKLEACTAEMRAWANWDSQDLDFPCHVLLDGSVRPVTTPRDQFWAKAAMRGHGIKALPLYDSGNGKRAGMFWVRTGARIHKCGPTQ